MSASQREEEVRRGEDGVIEDEVISLDGEEDDEEGDPALAVIADVLQGSMETEEGDTLVSALLDIGLELKKMNKLLARYIKGEGSS